MTNVDIAKQVGISAPPCLRRIRALEEMGFIKGYHAVIAPELLGYTVTIYAGVGLNSQKDQDLKAFEELVHTWTEVRECMMLAGETDFLLKVVARDWDHYQQFLTKHLTVAPNVAHVKSSLAVKSCKYAPGVPIVRE
jgi:DNA-binding Lrp family transcriptional regulator